jgi:serine/threonine protein phosphatase PrpC
LRIEFGASSDVGRARPHNEDCYCALRELGLFVLADGIGGQAKGEVASAMAVEVVTAHCMQAPSSPFTPFSGKPRPHVSERTAFLASAVHSANRKIRLAAAKSPAHRGMGATVVAAWLEGQRLSLAHVGDSRAYLLRAGALQHLTLDHSLAAERVRRGFITQREAQTSALQSVLLRAVGMDEEIEVDVCEHLLMGGDAVLLCTDGLTRMVSDSEIAFALSTCESAQAAADRLVAMANDHGGQDNITVVVLRMNLDGEGVLGWLRRWLRRSNGPPEAASSRGDR